MPYGFLSGVLNQQKGGIWDGLIDALEYNQPASSDPKTGFYSVDMSGTMTIADFASAFKGTTALWGNGQRWQDLGTVPYFNANPGSAHTMYLWFYSTSASGNSALCGHLDKSQYPTVTYPYTDFIHFNDTIYCKGISVSKSIRLDGNWHMCSLVFDGDGGITVGCDDSFSTGSANPTYMTANSEIYVGNPNVGTTTTQGYRVYGYIDCFRFFNRALSQSELVDHYNSGKGLELYQLPEHTTPFVVNWELTINEFENNVVATITDPEPGELLLCLYGCYSTSTASTSTASAGWTKIYQQALGGAEDNDIAGFYKVSDGTETSVTITNTASGGDGAAYVFRIKGARTSDPVDAYTFGNTYQNTAWDIPSVTTTVNNALVFAMVYVGKLNGTNVLTIPATGWSADDTDASRQIDATDGYRQQILMAHKLQATAGASGGCEVGNPSVDNAGLNGVQLSINPA